MVHGINLKTMEDIQQLNKYATNFNFDIYVHGKEKNEFIDAKSLLGLMNLVNKKNLKLVLPDHVNNKVIYQGIENLLS